MLSALLRLPSGMNVAVRSNVRTAEAAKRGMAPALVVAFKGGTVTGILVVALGIIGVAGDYGMLNDGLQDLSATKALVGLGPRRLVISVFARLGAASSPRARTSAPTWSGKIEAGIPEDDPRNAARDRGQRRRQRRRRRRHGGRPIRDLMR